MKTHTTNYAGAFITVAGDCPVTDGVTPAKADSVAGVQLSLLLAAPYALTSDELLFAVYALRKGAKECDLAEARKAFFAKPQACLRASPLVKSHGWGLHHNALGHVAAYPMGSARYAELAADPALKVVAGIRSKRA